MGKKRVIYLGVLLLGLIGGFSLGWALKSNKITENQATHYLLAKRIFVDNPNDSIINFEPSRQQVKAYASKYASKNDGSIYFEYLPTGVPYEYGMPDGFTAASLLKVPQAMTLYKAAEEGKIDMDRAN